MKVSTQNRLCTACLVLAGMVAAPHAHAATPAAPATAPASPKETVEAMVRSVMSADENAAVDTLVFSNDEAKAIALVMLRQIIAIAHLRRTLLDQFGAEAVETSVGRRELQDCQDMLDALRGAAVKIDGTSATVTLEKGPAFLLVKKEGGWKIDYEKTQKSMGGLPSKADVEKARLQTTALNQLAVDVKARKVESTRQAEARYQAIMEPPAETRP